MIQVKLTQSYKLQVNWSAQRAYELVADVPRSAGHFPGLKRLTDLGGNVYGWDLSPFQLGKHSFGVNYTARYICNPEQHTVTWVTVASKDSNTVADGQWEVLQQGSGARLNFKSSMVIDLPFPRLSGPLIRRTVPPIAERQLKHYLTAIAKTMDGRLLS